jgi:hypothetical protein
VLVPCGIRVEARVGIKDNETYEVLEIQERSTEERAVVAWPAKYEGEKDADWFIRVLYGRDMKQVRMFNKFYFLFEIIYYVHKFFTFFVSFERLF